MNKFFTKIKKLKLKLKWKNSTIAIKSMLIGMFALLVGITALMFISIANLNGVLILPETGWVPNCVLEGGDLCDPRPDCKCHGRVCGECSEDEDDDPQPTAVLPKPTATSKPIPTATPIPKPTEVVISAPTVEMSCNADINNLNITWKNSGLLPDGGVNLPPSVRVEISNTSDFNSQYWVLNIQANHAFSVLAPKGTAGTFVSPIDGNIMAAIARSTTYQVRVWYEAPYNKYSLTTVFTTPDAAGWNCPYVNQNLPSLGNVESPVEGGFVSGGFEASGWFLDPQTVKDVSVTMDGILIGPATLGVSRPDVYSVYPDYKNPNAGFKMWISTTQFVNGVPSAKYSNGSHTLTFKMFDGKSSNAQMTISKNIIINNILTTPTVQQYCSDGINKLWIQWDNAGLTESDFYVDISYWDTPSTNKWYNTHKNALPYQVVAPDNFTLGSDSNVLMPAIEKGKDMYVSIFFNTLKRHTLEQKITAVDCGIINNITPTIPNTNVPTNIASITPSAIVTPPVVTGLNPVGTINPGVQDIRWDPASGVSIYGLRVDDTTNGTNDVCSTPGTNDVCLDINTNIYSYNFLAGHTYHITVHAVVGSVGPDTSVDVTVAAVPLNPIAAPNVYVACENEMLNMRVNWNAENLGAQSYWVDISFRSDFVGNFWHKELVSSADSLTVTAPIDLDRGYFLEYQWPNPIMPSLQPNTTYYVKIWYHTPIYRNSIIRSVVTPNSCGVITTPTVAVTTTIPTVTESMTPTNTPVVTGTVTGPNVMATCDANNKPGLDIAWAVDPILGSYGYWVDIAQTLNGFNDGTYWHHGYGKSTDVTARAPIEKDGSYYFNKSDINMKWTGLQTPGTWYVRIWYAKTGTFSNITTYTYPAELTCP